MKRIVAFLTIVAAAALHAESIPWRYEPETAIPEAAKARLPALLVFTAPWCGYCRQMETTTWVDPRIEEAVKRYIAIKVDFDRNRELANAFQIRGIPAFVVLNRYGETVSVSSGYQDATQFGAWLEQHQSEAFDTISKTSKAAAAFTELEATLQSPEEAVRARGVAALLESYIDKEDPLHPLAGQRLEKLFEESPLQAAGYLKDSRLAVRLLFTNLFAAKFNDAFTFDPWAPVEERTAAADRWLEKLSVQKP